MTQPRRPDEIALYARLRATARAATLSYSGAPYCLSTDVDQAAADLGIPDKRACYLVDKWERKGWYETSSFPPGGRFTETAPEALTP